MSPKPASLRFALSCLLIGLIVQWIVYADSFRILPAGDDFPIVNEIHRGNQKGIAIFFSDSIIQIGYRPLKSLIIWAMGNLFWPHPMAGVRIANLLAVATCGLVVMLWVRSMGLGRAGIVTAIAMMLLHPVMTAATGSCDGVDSVASTALLWLGAWFVYHYRSQPVAAIVASSICFIVGVGFKENLFALVPLSCVVIAMFWSWRNRPVGALALLITLSVAAAAMIVVRFYAIRTGLSTGATMLRFGPKQLAENIAIFTTGLLFFGDSIWVYVHPSKLALAGVGLTCLIAVCVIVTGIRIAGRGALKRWTIFLLLGMACAAFPTIFLHHVSEMYVPPMVVPFALLCGIAAEGLVRIDSKTARPCIGVVVGIAFAGSIFAIRHKIVGLRDVGDRAADQVAQVIGSLPPDAHGLNVAVLFDATQLQPRRTYSVFRMGDEVLMVHKDVLDWPRPGKNLVLVSPSLDEAPKFDTSTVDVALRWDASTRRFTRVK